MLSISAETSGCRAGVCDRATEQSTVYMSETMLYVLGAVYVLTGILILITNICAIAAVVFDKKLHRPVNYYISSICAVNLLTSLALVPVVVLLFRGTSVTQTTRCNMRISQQFAGDVVLMHSIYIMMAIALDRYRAVVHPQKLPFSSRRCFKVIAVTWLIAVLYAVYPTMTFLSTKKQEYLLPNSTQQFCYYSRRGLTTKYLVDFILGYIIPLALSAMLYGRIIHRLWKRELHNMSATRMIEQSWSWKRRSIKMAVAILVVFALCWLPTHAIKLSTLYSSAAYSETLVILRHFATILSFCSSWVYVVVYAHFNLYFKHVALSIITCNWCGLAELIPRNFSNSSNFSGIVPTSVCKRPSSSSTSV